MRFEVRNCFFFAQPLLCDSAWSARPQTAAPRCGASEPIAAPPRPRQKRGPKPWSEPGLMPLRGSRRNGRKRIGERSGNGSGGESRPGEEGPKPRGSQAGPKPRARRVGLIRLVHGSEGKGATHVDRRSQQKLRYVTSVNAVARRYASEPSGAELSQP